MKNISVIIVITISLICVINAQNDREESSKSWNFGTRAGYINYDLRADNTSLKNGQGYYAGLFLEKHISEKWAFQLETNYNYSGFSTLHLPLLLKYNLSERFQLYTGPQLDFSFEQNSYDEDFKNKRFGASMVLGVQYNIDTHWLIDARYNYGVTNQFPVYQRVGSTIEYGKKGSFTIGFGYKF